MMKLEKNAQPTAATSCSRCRGRLSELASILSQPASIIQKRCRAAQEKVDVAMSRNRSLRMSPTSFLSMSPGSGLEISWKFYANCLPEAGQPAAPGRCHSEQHDHRLG